MAGQILKSGEYRTWLKDLKHRVRQAQIKAAVKVNSALLAFYWELGADIVERQKKAKWGSGFLKQLSIDLMAEFPDMKGFSKRNLERIRKWYLFYSESDSNCDTTCDAIDDKTKNLPGVKSEVNSETGCCAIEKLSSNQPESKSYSKWQQSVAQLIQIPWGHNLVIISKCKDITEALYYVHKTQENNWSRNVLTHRIESGLYQREGKAITNFADTLPDPQSDLAQQLIKDPYNFDFLTLTDDYHERELEITLVDHITRFLLELGAGSAYMGSEMPACRKA